MKTRKVGIDAEVGCIGMQEWRFNFPPLVDYFRGSSNPARPARVSKYSFFQYCFEMACAVSVEFSELSI